MLLQAQAQLQRALVRSNRNASLRKINGLPYSLALTLLRRLGNRAGIAGVYVRSSLASDQWVPGLSDIDPLVVLEAGHDRREERETAAAFRTAYRRLSRGFPMLGELEIVRADHLPGRLTNGVDAGASSSWLRLTGPPLSAEVTPAARERARRLSALRAYRYHLLPWCWAGAVGPRAPLVRGRALAKMYRALGMPAETGPVDGAPHEIALSALERLSAGIGEPPAGEGPTCDYATLLGGSPQPTAERWPLRKSVADACDGVVQSIFAPVEAPERVYVVLADGPSHGQRARCLETILREAGSPLVMDGRVLANLLLTVDPLEHFTLMHSRALLYGSDPLPLPWIPTLQTLRRSVLDYAVDMLGYPYAEEPMRLSATEFRNVLLGWFVRTVWYLEDGVLESGFDRQCDYYRGHFPELADRLDPDDVTSSAEQRFVVLRDLVDRIHSGMVTGGPGHLPAAPTVAGASSFPS